MRISEDGALLSPIEILRFGSTRLSSRSSHLAHHRPFQPSTSTKESLWFDHYFIFLPSHYSMLTTQAHTSIMGGDGSWLLKLSVSRVEASRALNFVTVSQHILFPSKVFVTSSHPILELLVRSLKIDTKPKTPPNPKSPTSTLGTRNVYTALEKTEVGNQSIFFKLSADAISFSPFVSISEQPPVIVHSTVKSAALTPLTQYQSHT
jgi:hypothetical protein